MQRFERALFPAPKQGQEPGPVRRGRVRNQRLLFESEIVGNKRIATRLDHFQIATHLHARHHYGASRDSGAVAE